MAPPQTAGLLSLEEDEDLPESGVEFQQKASSLSFLEACKVSMQYVQPRSRHTPLAGELRDEGKESGDALCNSMLHILGCPFTFLWARFTLLQQLFVPRVSRLDGPASCWVQEGNPAACPTQNDVVLLGPIDFSTCSDDRQE